MNLQHKMKDSQMQIILSLEKKLDKIPSVIANEETKHMSTAVTLQTPSWKVTNSNISRST
jgi:hypothetical protein